MDTSIGSLLKVAALFVGVGSALLAVVRPRIAWDLKMLFSARQYEQLPEPSEAGLRWTRFCGVMVLVALGLAGIAWLLTAID